MPELLLDAAGRRRLPATLPHFHASRGHPTRDPLPDPPTIEESIAVQGWQCSSVGSAPDVAI